MPTIDHILNARAARTRAAIVDAFIALVLERHYGAIRVSDVVAYAGTGKSTFYEHFRGKDEVLLEAMKPVLLALATAASGRAAHSHIRDMVCHLWDRRSAGRVILSSTAAPIIQRRLAEAIEPHVVRAVGDYAAPITAIGIAAAQLAMLQSWLAGRVTCSVDVMSGRLTACSALFSHAS